MEMSSGEIEFVNLSEIDIEKLYDTNGRKMETFPNQNANSAERIEEEKQYILRAEYGIEDINFYYIVQLANSGALQMEWIGFTEGEYIQKNLIDEMNLENNDMEEGELY